MRTILTLLFALVLWPAGLSSGARAQTGAHSNDDHALTVTNKTQHTITELRASIASDDDWGDDRLGDAGTIEPNHSFTLHLPGQDCTWDLQAKYDDGRTEERRGLNICRNRRLAFDGSGAAAPPDRHSTGDATVMNGTPRTITEVYVSPPSAQDWGSDRLGNDQLAAGHSIEVNVTGGCVQDVRVVYDNKSAEERRGLDLCAHARLNISPGWALSAELDSPRAPEGGTPRGDGEGGGDHIRALLPTP